MAKILIAAQLELDPAVREETVRTGQPYIDGALTQEGCLQYTWSINVNNPARIDVFEEWSDEKALANHFAGPHYAAMRAHIGGAGITSAASAKYLVAKEGTVYNAEGVATTDFE